MKKIFIALLLFVVFQSFTSCSNNGVTEPEEIGEQVFEILKNITTDSKQEYFENFLSVESGTKEYFSSLTSEEYYEKMDKNYNRIKAEAGETGIKWKEIEYLDFTYRINSGDVGKECWGELFFQYDNTSYSIKTRSFFYKNTYRLTNIYDLDRYKKID